MSNATKKLRALLAAATPGPMVYVFQEGWGKLDLANGHMVKSARGLAATTGTEADARLTTALHNATPALLAVVEAAQAMHARTQYASYPEARDLSDALAALEEVVGDE